MKKNIPTPLKILNLIIFCSIFFLEGHTQKKDTAFLSQTNSLDSLIVLAADSKIQKEARLDFAYAALKNITADKNTAATTNNYIDLANVFYQLNEKKQYLHLADLLYKKATLKNDFEGIAWSTYFKGNYFYNETNYDSSYYYFTKAEKANLELADNYLLGFIVNTKADILNIKKDYVNAEINSIKALKIGVDEKNDLLIYNCYISLGNSLLGLNNDDKAIEYFKKAITKSEDLKNDPQYLSLKAQAYNYIASAYKERKEYQKAISYANEALNFNKLKRINAEIYCYLTNNLAYSKFKLGNKAALNHFLETLKIGDSIKSIPVQIFSKMYLAEYYLNEKNFPKALKYITDARDQAHKGTFFEEELKSLSLLSLIDTKNSSLYSKRYIELSDSLQDVERATRNKFARIEFETDEITAAKNTAEEESKLLQLRMWVISIFGLLTILVIVLWFIIKGQKSKTRELLLEQRQQQANEEIYQLMLDQQEKIEEGKTIEKQRISLDLHDGVMGRLSAIRMNLYPLIIKSDLENKEEFFRQLDDIQKVEKEIRGVAHDLNANLFSNEINFIAVVKDFFAKIKNYSEINFELQIGDSINWDLINNSIKINLYRILQEALQNIEKYADAKNVTVTMSQIGNQVFVILADDGKGFDTSLKKDGIGLQNMKTRMDELHGKFSIQSEPEKGTKISLIIPI